MFCVEPDGNFVYHQLFLISLHRYEHRRQKTISPEEMQELGIKMKKPEEVSLDKEFQRIQGMDIDTWENKRYY